MKNPKQKLRVGAACLVAAALTAVAINTSNQDNIGATGTGGCYDVEFVWARGSGSPMGAPEYREFTKDVQEQLTVAGFGGMYNFHELGEAENGYPAQQVFAMTPEGFKVTIGAKIGAGESYAYGESVKAGVSELQNYINNRLTACPRTFFALGGYSQGAQVIGDTLVTLPKEIDKQVIHSVLYGDPKLYLPEGEGVVPTACFGVGLSEYRAHAPVCQTSAGILGARKPYVQDFQAKKVATYCNPEDMICGSTNNILSWNGHTSYIKDGLFLDGAERILAATKAALPAMFLTDAIFHSPNTVVPGQDVAILIDTTGSMNDHVGEFATAIADVKRLAEQVLGGGGRVALIEYRDTDSMFELGMPSRILCDFDTCDGIETVNSVINGLIPAEGGDYDESLLHGIMLALVQLNWRGGASKALVVYTDAGFHDPDPTCGWTIELVQQEAMKIDPVNIYVIKILPPIGDGREEHEEDFEQLSRLAELTGGEATVVGGQTGQKTVAEMLGEITRRPIARLASDRYFVQVGQQVIFDATGSTGVSSKIAYADWDLDGDGVFEISGAVAGLASLKLPYIFDEPDDRHIQVRVVDENGLSNTMSVNCLITEGPAGPLRRYSDVKLKAEKMVDDEGAEYLKISWAKPSVVSSYQLYVNGVPMGRFASNVTTASIYDLDFSRDIKVQIRAVVYDRDVCESEPVMVYAEPGDGGADNEFDWTAALEAIRDSKPKTGGEQKDEPESSDEASPNSGSSDTVSSQPVATGEPHLDLGLPASDMVLEAEPGEPVPSDSDGSASHEPAISGTASPDPVATGQSRFSLGLPASEKPLDNKPRDALDADGAGIESPDAGGTHYRDTYFFPIIVAFVLAAPLFLILIWRKRKKEHAPLNRGRK
jgi:hypothetical protein